jgi:hypothetical protein
MSRGLQPSLEDAAEEEGRTGICRQQIIGPLEAHAT